MPVNDARGHDTGDEVLQTVAGQIKNTVRQGALVCRTGGDEFGVLPPGVEDRET